MVLAALLATALPTGAGAKTMEQRMQAACRPDIEALYPDAGTDDVKACTTAKRRQVSLACVRLIDTSE